MSNLNSRVKHLEGNTPDPARPLWAELLDDGGAVLRFADGQRIQVQAGDIPASVKVYQGVSPDNWSKSDEQLTAKN